LYGPHPEGQVVGFGLSHLEGDSHRFRKESGIHSPFVLYSGRIESAKNVPQLVQNFVEYKRRRKSSLKLVLMGHGPEPIPKHSDVIRLGFKHGQAKADVYAAAAVLCQPSVNESFSIVVMESWLCGVPVLVHADCAVTWEHVVRSNGGLYFRDYDEFEAALDLMLGDESFRRRLCENGMRYARAQYNWYVVLQRFQDALEYWDARRGASE
jgi:glycosyltransferase involved in cell wall biosynthesis